MAEEIESWKGMGDPGYSRVVCSMGAIHAYHTIEPRGLTATLGMYVNQFWHCSLFGNKTRILGTKKAENCILLCMMCRGSVLLLG